MPSLPPDSAEVAAPVWEVARRLSPEPVLRLLQAGGGGNSRLYRVETAGAVYALKSYPVNARDTRDRLGQEFAALAFVAAHDGAGRVPVPVGADPATSFGLYSWVEGEAVGPTESAADIDAMVAFARRLHELGAVAGAEALAPASEACLSLDAFREQISRRHARLSEGAAFDAELGRWLEREFTPALTAALERAEALYAAAGLDPVAEIAPGQRCLSPSDFGFHNALRAPDGRLVFLDFEYFGWDDPVRLTADFCWHPHPRMVLPPALSARFLAGTSALYGAGDGGYHTRLAAQWPLVGLRWCMILLNEFLPERWAGRVHAGQSQDRRTVLSQQLAKARRFLERVDQAMAAPPSPAGPSRREPA